VDETLMNAIKDFFNKSIPGATKFESGVVNMRVYTPIGTNHKQVIQLVITRKDYFNNVLIPFFELFVLRRACTFHLEPLAAFFYLYPPSSSCRQKNFFCCLGIRKLGDKKIFTPLSRRKLVMIMGRRKSKKKLYFQD
jgi:hypothetical protein